MLPMLSKDGKPFVPSWVYEAGYSLSLVPIHGVI
jgi:hypothetical protein